MFCVTKRDLTDRHRQVAACPITRDGISSQTQRQPKPRFPYHHLKGEMLVGVLSEVRDEVRGEPPLAANHRSKVHDFVSDKAVASESV